MVRVVLVGATGSIGRSTLDVVRAQHPSILLHGVFAGSDGRALAGIAREFGARFAGLAGEAGLADLRAGAPPGCRTGRGPALLEEAIADPDTDVVLSAASGAAGLPASLEAVRRGKTLALANKESMVMAGPLLLKEAARTGARIVPVDSEHSAIFQALRAGRRTEVRRVLLTASGGPFRTWTKEQLAAVRPEDALRHPTWDMGPRITVDSATLMNKALELVEAHSLFELDAERLDVIVHPQSVVHGLVEFVDGSVIAQMGVPDMRVPIQHALTYPERHAASFAPFDLRAHAQLTFEAPDRERFPALTAGERAIRLGGTAGAILNAAGEVAVARFLAGELAFPGIAETVLRVLDDARIHADPSLDDIYAADRAAREDAAKCPN